MAIERVPEPRAACGVQGCLFGAVALFVVLLIAMLIIAYFRFQEPPVPRVERTVEPAARLATLGLDDGPPLARGP